MLLLFKLFVEASRKKCFTHLLHHLKPVYSKYKVDVESLDTLLLTLRFEDRKMETLEIKFIMIGLFDLNSSFKNDTRLRMVVNDILMD